MISQDLSDGFAFIEIVKCPVDLFLGDADSQKDLTKIFPRLNILDLQCEIKLLLADDALCR